MSDEAAPILTRVQKAFLDRINAVRIAKSLRKLTTPTRSALLMEQAQLRIRARKKFGCANSMFFTRRGLEQATSETIAKYKAKRFANLQSVADICCGIGGDLISLADRGDDSTLQHTVGVDQDEHTCLFAEKNIEVHGRQNSTVEIRQIDFANFDAADCDGIHIDPDRRMKARTVHGNQFSPSLSEVFEKTPDRCSLAVKVAPATPSAAYFPTEIQREWIGDRRECKQQVLWSGPATNKPGHRTATYVGRDGAIHQVSAPEVELDDQTIDFSEGLQQYVFEPHPAVLAAGLTDEIARKHGLKRFTAEIVYLTGDRPVNDPLLAQFEVLEVMPMNLRKTIQALQARNVGTVEIKKRGIEDVTANIYGRMRLQGDEAATVILTRLGKKRISVITNRIKSNH